MLKMTISTIVWGAQHPNAGGNIQHLLASNFINIYLFFMTHQKGNPQGRGKLYEWPVRTIGKASHANPI